jgi:hypothetical protein
MATSRLLFFQTLYSPSLVVNMQTNGAAVAQSPAILSPVLRYQGGSALLTPGGAYTSIQERYYRVQVTSTTNGSFGGTRYRWSDTDGATWNEQGVTPQPGAPKLLNHGISITFTAGGILPEFVLGDTWWFKVVYPFGLWASLDGSRNTEWRSGVVHNGGTLSWDMDFGVPARPTALYLMDHNFPTLSQILLTASNAGFGGTPSFVHQAPWSSGQILSFFTPPASYRYWRLLLSNFSGVSWPYFRVSEVFLGNWHAFSKNFLVEFSRPQRRLAAVGQNLRYGVGPGSLSGDDLEVTWSRMPAVDQVLLEELWAYTNRPDIGVQRPFAFMPYDGDPGWWHLFHWVNDHERQFGPSFRYSNAMSLQEVVRSRA